MSTEPKHIQSNGIVYVYKEIDELGNGSFANVYKGNNT